MEVVRSTVVTTFILLLLRIYPISFASGLNFVFSKGRKKIRVPPDTRAERCKGVLETMDK